MRKGIDIEASAADRARLEAIAADRNSPQKHVWRARIILATGEGCGTAEVMRRASVSKPCVWRWQERFMTEGVDGLLRDKTRPARIPPLPKAVVETVVTRTLEEPPPDGTPPDGTAPALAMASGLSVGSLNAARERLKAARERNYRTSSELVRAALEYQVPHFYDRMKRFARSLHSRLHQPTRRFLSER